MLMCVLRFEGTIKTPMYQEYNNYLRFSTPGWKSLPYSCSNVGYSLVLRDGITPKTVEMCCVRYIRYD